MDYKTIPQEEIINKTIKAVKDRGIDVILVNNKEEALEKVKELIPDGASIMNSSSTTLEEIGFVDYLKEGTHFWKNLHEEIFRETDKSKIGDLYRKTTLADYFLGSIHAITEDGIVVTASNSGSQLPSYAFSSPHVIWVAGAQKIVPQLKDALKRIREYVLSLENERAQKAYGVGSNVSKLLIIEKETSPGRIILVLAKEVLGF